MAIDARTGKYLSVFFVVEVETLSPTRPWYRWGFDYASKDLAIAAARSRIYGPQATRFRICRVLDNRPLPNNVRVVFHSDRS